MDYASDHDNAGTKVELAFQVGSASSHHPLNEHEHFHRGISLGSQVVIANGRQECQGVRKSGFEVMIGTKK